MPDRGALIIVGYLATMVAIVCGWLYMRSKRAQEQVVEEDVPAAAPQRARGQRGRIRRGRRNDADDDEDDYNNDAEPDGDDDEPDFKNMSKADRKKWEKEQQKKEKRAYREQVRQNNEEKKERKDTKQAAYDAARRKREEARQEKERLEAEAELKAQLEKEAKEAEEFAEWKDMISVEGGGDGAADVEAQSQRLLTEFVEFIKRRKVVMLDDLAAEFGIKTDGAVARIDSLVASGDLTGVLDEKGKFMFIAPDDLDKVSAFINKKGRFTIHELLKEANKVIDLTPEDEEGLDLTDEKDEEES